MTKEHVGYKRKCKNCNKDYWAGNAKGRYCSDKCRVQHFRNSNKNNDAKSSTSLQWETILEKHKTG